MATPPIYPEDPKSELFPQHPDVVAGRPSGTQSGHGRPSRASMIIGFIGGIVGAGLIGLILFWTVGPDIPVSDIQEDIAMGSNAETVNGRIMQVPPGVNETTSRDDDQRGAELVASADLAGIRGELAHVEAELADVEEQMGSVAATQMPILEAHREALLERMNDLRLAAAQAQAEEGIDEGQGLDAEQLDDELATAADEELEE